MADLLLPGGIFLVTLALIILRPRGLAIGTSAVAGALAALAAGVVSWHDVLTVTGIVWDATLAFIGIILLSMVLDEIGFFEWAALHMARASRGSGPRLFLNMLLLGALVAALFANDGAALILTPIVLAKMRHLKMDPAAIFAFVMAGGFIGDAASSPLVISNLTNIVTAGYFGIGFADYARTMLLPNLVAIVASIGMLWLVYRRAIPATVDLTLLPEPASAIRNRTVFLAAWPFLGLLLGGYFLGDRLGLPVSLFALGGALFFLAFASYHRTAKPWMTLKTAPWQVVWFSIGLYVVVYGLKNGGLTDTIGALLEIFIGWGHTASVLGTGFLAAGLSSVMNNMPTVMVMDIAIGRGGDPVLAYANIIGCNLGPKMTPIGSLATLLWLHVLAGKGVAIGWREYIKAGLLLTPPVLAATLLTLP